MKSGSYTVTMTQETGPLAGSVLGKLQLTID